jgi:hypothetical protein
VPCRHVGGVARRRALARTAARRRQIQTNPYPSVALGSRRG